MKEVLNVLAIERPSLGDWKLKEPQDGSFIKLHSDIVKKQKHVWEHKEKIITECLFGSGSKSAMRNSSKPNMADRLVPSKNSNKIAPKASLGVPSRASIPDETRESLPKALQKVFQSHKLCR